MFTTEFDDQNDLAIGGGSDCQSFAMDLKPYIWHSALSGIVFCVMLRLSVVRSGLSPGTGSRERLFLFFSTLLIVIVGYYIQGILEFILNTQNVAYFMTAQGIGFLFLLSGVIPGSIAGYGMTSAKVAGLGRVRATIRVFAALTVVDFYLTIQGSTSYRSFLFCVCCNLVGASLTVLLVYGAYKVMSRYYWRNL
jgi:hypothetical protein